MEVELKTVEKQDEKILTKMYFDSLDFSPIKWKRFIGKNIIRVTLLRKYLFRRVYSSKLISSRLVLFEKQIIGFALLSWADKAERKHCILTIYVKSGFPRKNIEELIFDKTVKFCIEKNLPGFSCTS